MASWPSVGSLSAPDYGMGDVLVRPLIETDFEANYVQKRAAFTRSRRRFDMSWGKLPEAQWSVLDTFVRSIGGEMFGYTHPVTSTVYTCTIVGGSYDAAVLSFGFRRAKIALEEV